MSKAKIISLSTLYATVELLEPTYLQQGQIIELSPAMAKPIILEHGQMQQFTYNPPPAKPIQASITTSSKQEPSK